MGIAVGGFDFKHTVTDFKNRDIKCAASQVENRNCTICFLIESIGQGCGRRLIDDS